MRVGIIGVCHESNTFIAKPTTLEDFRKTSLISGEEIRKQFVSTHHEIAGFFEGLAEANIDAVPIYFARTLPSGTINAEAADYIVEQILSHLKNVGPLDGLLLCPHGANVAENHPDLDGYWLSRVRAAVGPAMPIVCTIDPHCNLSPLMIDSVNATIAYRTNPHLDQRPRGLEAARLLIRTLRGEVKPTQAAAFPPIAINIERQLTSASPCKELYILADEVLKRPGVLTDSVVLGFPYSDVEEMGSALIVVTDNDPAAARKYADELAAHLFKHRQDFVAVLTPIPQAVEEATKHAAPVTLLDMGDNVGGGSPGDSTLIAHEVFRRGGPRTFVALWDPQAVQVAQKAGVGATLSLAVGAKTDNRHGLPLHVTVKVKSLHEGRFYETQARHGGLTEYDMGLTAIVETILDGKPGPLTIQLTTQRTIPFSLHQIISCGLDPKAFQILVAKGVHAPIGAYGPISSKTIRVNTAGSTSADMTSFTYHRRRRPLFPLEEIASVNA
jgi:microcystin degradation protein MlrC